MEIGQEILKYLQPQHLFNVNIILLKREINSYKLLKNELIIKKVYCNIISSMKYSFNKNLCIPEFNQVLLLHVMLY